MNKYNKYIGHRMGGRVITAILSDGKQRQTETRVSTMCVKCGATYENALYDMIRKDKPIVSCRKCNKITHGMTHTRIYKIWQGIKKRCDNPNIKQFKNYGGRGIGYDNRWIDFDNFFIDMKDGYSDDLTIERKDNEKGYSKDNCKWATLEEQANNKTTNKMIEINGEKKSLSVWCKQLGRNYSTVRSRINLLGWDGETAVLTETNGK